MRRRDGVVSRGLLAGLSLTLALAVLAALGRRRERRVRDGLVDRLHGRTAQPSDRGVSAAETERLDDLPDPVRRYLETALPAESRPPESVRIEQRGALRTGGADSPWRPFTATHHATVRPVGFVWDAVVEPLPFVSVHVRDAFVDGAGSSHVSLFGVLPVGSAGATSELDEAALQRYLAEAVWYPTALLPANGVSWEGVDDRTARATLTCGETTASLTFHFRTRDGDAWENDAAAVVVERVHTTCRYRAVGGGFEPTPWTGLWREYEERAGVVVPTTGEVIWHLPDEDFHAWRGTVERFSSR